MRSPSGCQVFPGFPSNAVNTSRNNVAFYADLEGNVTNRLRVATAGRFEHYSDFGSNLDGQITLRMKAHERLVLQDRPAPASGLVAGAVELFRRQHQLPAFPDGNGPGGGHIRRGEARSRALGATDLKPEDSVQLTAGLPSSRPSFDFTADYYNITIDDRIVFSGISPEAPSPHCSNRWEQRSAVLHERHQHSWKLASILTAKYNTTLSDSTLRLFAGYNHNRTRIRGDVATPQLAGLGNVLYDRVETRAHRMRPAKQPGSRHRRLDEEPLRAQHERRTHARQLLCEAAAHHRRG